MGCNRQPFAPKALHLTTCTTGAHIDLWPDKERCTCLHFNSSLVIPQFARLGCDFSSLNTLFFWWWGIFFYFFVRSQVKKTTSLASWTCRASYVRSQFEARFPNDYACPALIALQQFSPDCRLPTGAPTRTSPVTVHHNIIIAFTFSSLESRTPLGIRIDGRQFVQKTKFPVHKTNDRS